MNIALILSGGTGKRFGEEIPKQYRKVKEKMILSYCLDTIQLSGEIDAVQIVADEKWREQIRKSFPDSMLRGFSDPGENRQLSILNGLRDISLFAQKDDVVFIHDAARPLLSKDLIHRSLNAIKGHDGVLPVLPMKDTVYLCKEGKIASLLQRECVFAGQAPETFYLGSYLKANEALLPNEIWKVNGSAEPAVLNGMDIITIPGEENNFKITTQDDLQRFEQLL